MSGLTYFLQSPSLGISLISFPLPKPYNWLSSLESSPKHSSRLHPTGQGSLDSPVLDGSTFPHLHLMKYCSSFKAQYKHSFLCEYYDDLSFLFVLSERIAHPGSDPVFILPIYLCMNSHVLADDPYWTLCSLVGQSGGGVRKEENRDMISSLPLYFLLPKLLLTYLIEPNFLNTQIHA